MGPGLKFGSGKKDFKFFCYVCMSIQFTTSTTNIAYMYQYFHLLYFSISMKTTGKCCKMCFVFKMIGEYCETKIPFCTKEYNPCRNGARCVDHFTHYTCECAVGYTGENCTVNVDDCQNNMCQVCI